MRRFVELAVREAWAFGLEALFEVLFVVRAHVYLDGRRAGFLTRVQKDDFERLYRRHADRLFSFLAYRTGDRGLAEDLLADTFERVLNSRRGPKSQASEKAWLYTVALNVLRDRLRREDAEARAVGRDAARSAPADPLDAVEARRTVLPALVVLSVEEREVIALRFGAALTVPETAVLLGEPLTTVEGRLYRALRKLRRELEDGVGGAA